jgi:tRNA A-37 threonylcarbamoyl transferase component Bud32
VSDPEKLGKYVVEGVLGKGAMGIVYKARDPHIERRVAIKTVRKDVLDAELVPQFMARFRNEARAAGRLHHPNIVAIYEYGEDDMLAYIAMEYVDGLGLREYLNRKATFTLGQVASMITQLLRALAFAHAQGVVHRDVKPANLILTPAGTIKVADFGIARIDATTLTMTGMVMGTPSYMAPEQCRGLASDGRADLFSVGVVLYELLTGTRPFDGSIEAIAYRICHERHRPASERAPIALPSGLDAVIDRALAKDAADRFPDAPSFEAALQAAVAGVTDASGNSEATVINLADVPLAAPTTPVFDEALLATIERQLVRFVGPMARILVRQAAARARDTDELCNILGEHITDAGERARFEKKAQAAESSGAQRMSAAAVKPTGASASAAVAASTHGARPLEPAFVEQTTARLAVYLGPIARVVTRKAAQQARDCDEFVELVAQHIGTQDRHAFLREMREKQGRTPKGA